MESPPTKFTFIHEAAPGVSLSDRARASVEESRILTTIPIDKPCERLDNTALVKLGALLLLDPTV